MHLAQIRPNREKIKKEDFKSTFKIAHPFWSSIQLHLSNIVLQAKVLCSVSSGDRIYK